MYRVLFYNYNNTIETENSKQALDPATWFDGVYYRNEVPFPILFNKKSLHHSVSKELVLEKGQRFIEIDLNQLMRIESTPQGSMLFLENKAFWITEKNIALFEKDLDSNMFFRVNNKTLINMHHLESFITCDAIVTLSDKEAIPVDAKIKDKLFEFLKGRQIL